MSAKALAAVQAAREELLAGQLQELAALQTRHKGKLAEMDLIIENMQKLFGGAGHVEPDRGPAVPRTAAFTTRTATQLILEQLAPGCQFTTELIRTELRRHYAGTALTNISTILNKLAAEGKVTVAGSGFDAVYTKPGAKKLEAPRVGEKMAAAAPVRPPDPPEADWGALSELAVALGRSLAEPFGADEVAAKLPPDMDATRRRHKSYDLIAKWKAQGWLDTLRQNMKYTRTARFGQ